MVNFARTKCKPLHLKNIKRRRERREGKGRVLSKKMRWARVEMYTTFQRENTFSSLSMESIPNKYVMVPYFNKVHCRYLIGMRMRYYWCILVFIINIWLNSYYYSIYFYWILLVLCNKRSFNINCYNLRLVEAFTHKQENKICMLDNNI